MATATTPDLFPIEDIVQRHLKRTLPCKLNREELTDIAIAAAKKRRHLRELEQDLAAEKKRRQQQIDELQREIDTADRELDTEEQDRVVLCDLVFRGGMVHTRRRDTAEEFESRPATAQEAQRFLPAVESTLQGADRNAPLLDQATAAQGRSKGGESDDGVPEGLEPGEDDGLGDEEEQGDADDADQPDADQPDADQPDEDQTPAQKAVRESEQGRAKRRAGGGGKRGGKANGK